MVVNATNGLCECGCGLPAALAQKRVTVRGVVYEKGQPRRFHAGHTARKRDIKTYRRTTISGVTKRLHRLRAERALGRPLPAGAEVHHLDGSTSEHSPLVICPDRAYHMLLHQRMRVLAMGGDPNVERKCADCKRLRPFAEFYTEAANQCRECNRARCRRTRVGRKVVAA